MGLFTPDWTENSGPEYPRDPAYGRAIPVDKRYSFLSWKSPHAGPCTIQHWECEQTLQGYVNYVFNDMAARGFSPFDPEYWQAIEAEMKDHGRAN